MEMLHGKSPQNDPAPALTCIASIALPESVYLSLGPSATNLFENP